MQSLTKVAHHLKIGKARLYVTIDELGIKPKPIGNRKMLTPEQVELIRSSIHPESETDSETESKSVQTELESVTFGTETESAPFQDTNRTEPSHQQHRSESAPNSDSKLIAVLENRIEHLERLLDHEQAERQAERNERANYQTMLAALQQNNQKLLQENNRLQLEMLEAPRRHEVRFESKEQEEETATPQEFKVEDIPPETIANRNSRSGSRAFGVGLSVAAIIGVLFYAAITQGGDWLSDSLERGISTDLKVNGTEPDTR
ncbi:MAG: hypothetical protein VXA48_19095 [Deltaproteobacteria bacterium]